MWSIFTLCDHNGNDSFVKKNNVIEIDFPHFIHVKTIEVWLEYTLEIYKISLPENNVIPETFLKESFLFQFLFLLFLYVI